MNDDEDYDFDEHYPYELVTPTSAYMFSRTWAYGGVFLMAFGAANLICMVGKALA